MLRNNIAIITKNNDNLQILKDIIAEMESNIFTYKTIEDFKNNPYNVQMDAIFCYYDEIKNISHTEGFKNLFLIDKEFNMENKKLVYDNLTYEYLYEPLNSMDILHRLQIINEHKLEVRNSDSASISLLTQLVNIKDGDTNGHLMRVRNIVGLFLEELLKHEQYKYDLSESVCYDIAQASLLHDLGKMMIPEEILQKTGVLSYDEFEIMRQHTIIGHKILSTNYNKFTANNIIKIAIDVAESHHERWNGGGYPNDLHGDQIPLPARIVGICDVYDSVMSSNAYKNSSTHDHAFTSVVLEGGKRFDPDLINAFKNIKQDILDHKPSRFSKMKTLRGGKISQSAPLRGS